MFLGLPLFKKLRTLVVEQGAQWWGLAKAFGKAECMQWPLKLFQTRIDGGSEGFGGGWGGGGQVLWSFQREVWWVDLAFRLMKSSQLLKCKDWLVRCGGLYMFLIWTWLFFSFFYPWKGWKGFWTIEDGVSKGSQSTLTCGHQCFAEGFCLILAMTRVSSVSPELIMAMLKADEYCQVREIITTIYTLQTVLYLEIKKNGISLNGEETLAQKDGKYQILSYNIVMSSNLSSKILAFHSNQTT